MGDAARTIDGLRARVQELLEANTREVERRRQAERERDEFARRLTLIEPASSEPTAPPSEAVETINTPEPDATERQFEAARQDRNTVSRFLGSLRTGATLVVRGSNAAPRLELEEPDHG